MPLFKNLLVRFLPACALSACMLLAGALLACDEDCTSLDNPEMDALMAELSSSISSSSLESSSSLGRFDPQYGQVANAGEPVDTAARVAEELGLCTVDREKEITRTTFCGETCYVICDSAEWRYATMDERDVDGFPKDAPEGSIRKGNLLSLDRVYVFEDGKWRFMTIVEKNLGYCDSSIYDKIDSLRGSYYYCMEPESGKHAEWAEIPAMQADYFMLPDSAKEDDLSYGERSGRFFLYRQGNWHMAVIEDVIGYCYERREGKVTKFGDAYVVCRSGMWVSAVRSDLLDECNADSEGKLRRIQRFEFRCGSGEWKAVSLQSHAMDSSFYWDALVDDLGRVRLDSATATSGYFFEYTDLPYSGNSSLEYPSNINSMGSALRLAPLVDEYGGISAAAKLGGGYQKPFAGIGFNLWNGRVWSDSAEGVDIRRWKGLCIAYESDKALTLSIAPEGRALLEGGNYHKVRLEARSGVQVVDIPFEEFRQDSGYGYPESLETVLASAASILFYIEGDAAGVYWFAVNAIGSLGQCERYRLPGLK